MEREMAEGNQAVDDIRTKVFVLLSDPSRAVSTTYGSYVRPFCEIGGRFSDFLFPDDELRAQPPTILKVRMYLYQLLVRLDHCAQCEIDDPLPLPAYRPILALARVVSPLAGAMGQDVVVSVFEELRTVHAPRWERTLMRLEDDLGISPNEPNFDIPDPPQRRAHYQESAPAPTARQPPPTARGGLFHGQAPELERVIRVRIKRTKHGPDLSDVRPLLTRK
jgi:hypothetical protein